MAEPPGSPPPGRSWSAVYARRRFAVLLVLLVLILAGPPVLFGFGLSAGWFDVLTSLAALAAVLSLCFEPRQRAFALLSGVPTILLSLGGRTLPEGAATGALFFGHACSVLFFFGAAALVVRSLFGERAVTFDGVLGAACGYVFLGLAWAVLYSTAERFQPGSFQIADRLATREDPPRPLPHVLTYYSFVTLTTAGYGDVTPVSPAARTFAWLEALTGQFYLAVVVAGLVALLIESAGRSRADASDPASSAPRSHDSSP
jgi:hypothetical protein